MWLLKFLVLLLTELSLGSNRSNLKNLEHFFFSWRLITSQYCSGSCHTLTIVQTFGPCRRRQGWDVSKT